MDQNSFRKSLSLVILVIVAFIFLGATKAPAGSEKEAQIVLLKDFTKMEVRGIGITLDKEIKIHISAVGGGDKSVWQDAFGDKESQQMYAAGWIINAKTRKLVWDMTMDNTSGQSNNRKCDEDITLKKGSYEVYYQAFGYASGGSFSMN